MKYILNDSKYSCIEIQNYLEKINKYFVDDVVNIYIEPIYNSLKITITIQNYQACICHDDFITGFKLAIDLILEQISR